VLLLTVARWAGSSSRPDSAAYSAIPTLGSCDLFFHRGLRSPDQARNRTGDAVERTTPFTLYCYTIVELWYATHDTSPAMPPTAARPRLGAPARPNPIADIAAKLRCVIIAARFSPTAPVRPTEADIRTVQHAWPKQD
jgi:hypothetical protein